MKASGEVAKFVFISTSGETIITRHQQRDRC